MRIHSNQHFLSDKEPNDTYSLEELRARLDHYLVEELERTIDRVHRMPEVFRNSQLAMVTCPHCMEKLSIDVQESGDELNVYLSGEPCPYPQGLPAFEVELDVPSGVLVFNEDLHALVPYWNKEREGYHPVLMKEKTLNYAKKDLGYFFVTNHLSLLEWVSLGEEQWELRKAKKSSKKPKIPLADRFLCVMDETHYLQRCKDLGMTPHVTERVSVKPGRWSFQCDYNALYQTTFEHPPKVFLKSVFQGPCLNLTSTSSDFEHPPSLEKSHLWSTLERLSDFPCEPISYLLVTLGNGFHWSFGQWSDTNDRRDRSFRVQNQSLSLEDQRRVESIPIYDLKERLHDSSIYPLSERIEFVDTMPEQADRYWLAMGLIFFKSLTEQPAIFQKKNELNSPVGQEQWFQMQLNHAQNALNHLCQLTSQSKRWEEIEQVFEEMSIDFLPQLSHPSSPEKSSRNDFKVMLSL